MNQLKTSSKLEPVDTKPLFASTWMALFTVLRKNYNERNTYGPVNTANLHTAKQKQTKQKSHSI